MPDDDVRVCDDCGASVYKEHLTSGIARYEGNKLLCSHCAVEHDRTQQEKFGSDGGGAFEPIELDNIDERPTAEQDMSSSRIHQMTERGGGKAGKGEEFERSLDPSGAGASRCRTFHCRISDGAVEFMNTQVNEWLDKNPDVTIKFASSVIGMFEGKHTEPNIIITVFF